MSTETYMPMQNCARDLLGEMIMKDKGEEVGVARKAFNLYWSGAGIRRRKRPG